MGNYCKTCNNDYKNIRQHYKTQKHKLNTINISRCCICSESNDISSVVSRCNHVFHEKCINEWFGYSDKCPLCRNVICKYKYEYKSSKINSMNIWEMSAVARMK